MRCALCGKSKIRARRAFVLGGESIDRVRCALCVLWRVKDQSSLRPMCFEEHERMCRLIWAFTLRICPKACLRTARLINLRETATVKQQS